MPKITTDPSPLTMSVFEKLQRENDELRRANHQLQKQLQAADELRMRIEECGYDREYYDFEKERIALNTYDAARKDGE